MTKKLLVSHFNNAVLWPPRSPHLTPMNFFLWGYLKNLVYSSYSLLDLRDKIKQNIQNILSETLKNIKNPWVQKLQLSYK
jgi:hypothetical protein